MVVQAPAVMRSGARTRVVGHDPRWMSVVATTRAKLIQMYAPSNSVMNARSGPTGGAKRPISRLTP